MGKDNRVRFFFFERCILGNENFDPNARRLTKLEANEIFIDFAISREPFGPDRTKISEVGAE